MFGPARDMDFIALDPDRAALVRPMPHAMGGAEQRHLGAIDEGTPGRQAFQACGDPARLLLGKANRRAARHAQRRGQHNAPPGRVDPQRGAARPGTSQEGHRQHGSRMGDAELFRLRNGFFEETPDQRKGRHVRWRNPIVKHGQVEEECDDALRPVAGMAYTSPQ